MAKTDQNRFKYWWKEDQPHESIVAAVQWLDSNQSLHSELNRRHLILYGNRLSTGMGSDDYAPKSPTPANRLMLNVVQSVVDAACSQIATSKPRIMNLTEAGSWSQQQRAKKRDKWTQGIFYETGAYALGRMAFKDACIFGTGMLKVVEENGRACLQRAIVDDILIDDRDARNGKPRQMFEVREVPRDVLMAAYPDHQDKIRDAKNEMRVSRPMQTGVSDLVSVAEAFHLQSSEDAGDGKHVICISNEDLIVEDWTKPYFPYASMRWGVAPLGFWGWGIAEQLTGLQVELNYLLQKIQRLMTIATSQLWMRKGSGIDKNKMNNEDWAIREYVTEPPIAMNIQSVSPEYFQHARELVARAYEMTGVNQLTAQAQKPPGLNSGKALESYQDTQSQRFMEVAQRYEEMFVTIGDMLCDKAQEIAERDGEYKVKARDRATYELLDWKELKADRDQFITQPYPTNFFPQTPSGKWAQVERMMGSNFLSQEEAAELLDYPDLSAVTRLRNAPIEYVRKIIEDIMEHGQYRTPEPYAPLNLVVRMLPNEILRAKQDDAPRERIEMLQQYLVETLDRLQALEPPPQPPQPPQVAPGGPMAMGGAGPMQAPVMGAGGVI